MSLITNPKCQEAIFRMITKFSDLLNPLFFCSSVVVNTVLYVLSQICNRIYSDSLSFCYPEIKAFSFRISFIIIFPAIYSSQDFLIPHAPFHLTLWNILEQKYHKTKNRSYLTLIKTCISLNYLPRFLPMIH